MCVSRACPYTCSLAPYWGRQTFNAWANENLWYRHHNDRRRGGQSIDDRDLGYHVLAGLDTRILPLIFDHMPRRYSRDSSQLCSKPNW